MRIEDIYNKNGSLIVRSSDGVGSFETGFEVDVSKYVGLEVCNVSDFKKFDNVVVEKAFLNSLKSPWKFFDNSSRTLPRPLGVVYSKSYNFKEFLVLSFDSKSVIKSWLANKEIAEKVSSKINSSFNDEEILVVLSEVVEKVSKRLGFTFRLGVNVGASRLYKDKEYVYSDRELDVNEHYEYLKGLIERFNLCYVEDPFIKSDKKTYKKFVNEMKSLAFVCPGNGVLLKEDNVNSLNVKFNGTKILEYKNRMSVHLAVGLGINVLKCSVDDSLKEYEKIMSEMKKLS